jgi:RNA polymerase sigma-70 factor, ECF subfamily
VSDFDRLLAAAKAGDEEAFAALFRSVQPLLLRYLRTLGGSLADDCAAETWVNVVTGLDRFHGDESNWRAWVVTIGRRRLIDAQRRQGRVEMLDDHPEDLVEPGRQQVPDVAATVEEADGTARALGLLRVLPLEQREAVFLRHVVGLDVKQTAALVGRTPGSVRVATHRGLRRLEALVTAEQPQVPPPA